MLHVRIDIFFVVIISLVIQASQAAPPFSGTIFIDPDIITASDTTTFQGVSYAGQDLRLMFDRRVPGWINVNAHLFDASFDDGLKAEIQVNPEFGSSDAALVEAQKYGAVIGRLPTSLRADVETVWIHQGIEPFGGGNNNLLIHTGQADRYTADGILEETLVHEAAHTSLDASYASAPSWLAAQAADGEFISTYARDFPDREDVAESFLPYLSIRYRSDRISQPLADTIMQTIPNRIDYFDGQPLDMYPLVETTFRCDFDLDGDCNVNDINMLLATGDLVTGVSDVGGGNATFDLNGDGVINLVDLDRWLADAATQNGFASPYLQGDADLDGVVGSQDLNVLGINWLKSDQVWSSGDFNGDGFSNAADLNLVGINWLQSVPSAASPESVPEPFGIVNLGFIILLAPLLRLHTK